MALVIGSEPDVYKRQIKAGLEGLVGRIDGLIKAEVMRGYDPDNYDLCLYSEFTSKQALNSYKENEKHKACLLYTSRCV